MKQVHLQPSQQGNEQRRSYSSPLSQPLGDAKIFNTSSSATRRERDTFVIQKGSDSMPFMPPALASSLPASTSSLTFFDTPQPVLTMDILRQTGLGLKLRLFLALSCLALVPAIPLALIVIEGGKVAPFLSGRNAFLCVLAIFVAIVLVATWAALPVIRPIRRATRQIDTTAEEITALAQQTLTIAGEHGMGMTIIAGASARLAGRRQSIIRDCRIIVRSCQGVHTHVKTLFQKLPPHTQLHISEQAMLQEIRAIAQLAHAIATGLENDTSLESLKQAMTSAQDFSQHFKLASTHLQQEAEQIEKAARTLL